MAENQQDKLNDDFNDKFAFGMFVFGILMGLCKLHGLSVFCGLWIVSHYIWRELVKIRKIMQKAIEE